MVYMNMAYHFAYAVLVFVLVFPVVIPEMKPAVQMTAFSSAVPKALPESFVMLILFQFFERIVRQVVPVVIIVQLSETIAIQTLGSKKIRAFVYLDYDPKQTIQTLIVTSYDRHERNSQQAAQLHVIQLRSALLQFIVHIQRYHHTHIHVNELCGQKKIALQVAGIHHIDHYIGKLLIEVFAHIHLFGSVSRQ